MCRGTAPRRREPETTHTVSFSAIGFQLNVFCALLVSIVLALGFELPGLPCCAFGNADLRSSEALLK